MIGEDVTTPPAGEHLQNADRTIALAEESVVVTKRRVVTRTVQVRTLTDMVEDSVEADLTTTDAVIERLPVGRIIDAVPQTRVENGVTIVPVFEEVLVIERRIRLVEELHIRPETTSASVRLPVTVRRQRAVVNRLPVGDSTTSPPHEGTTPMSNMNTDAAMTYDRTITAFFDSRSDAEVAVERIVEAGVARHAVKMVEGADPMTGATTTAAPVEERSFFDKLGDFFMPDEDRHTYAEGLRRGGYFVSVPTTVGNRDKILDILDDEGTVDMNERETAWRSEGWSGTETGYAASTGGSAMATGSAIKDAGLVARDETYARTEDTKAYRAADADRSAKALGANRDGTIEVVEENLRVGKRDVSHGRVRVRSYVVEDAVSQDVNLRSERVEVERRAVDRPVSGLDDAFQDRTIELEETAEEAVVSKEARVKEEIDLKRLTENHTQTVSDTVRRTEVEIEDERTGKPATSDKLASDETLTAEERAPRRL